jgi:type II secretory pathway pseudopilin PulG
LNRSNEKCCPGELCCRLPACGGFSYVEVLLSAVIISILLVSALKLFGNLGSSAQRVVDNDVAESLALEMIEEIKKTSYRDPIVANEFGLGGDETGASRIKFDDVDDYNNWTACPPVCNDGTSAGAYPNFTRSVRVNFVAANNFSQQIGTDQGFKKVVITISANNRILVEQKYIIADLISARMDGNVQE